MCEKKLKAQEDKSVKPSPSFLARSFLWVTMTLHILSSVFQALPAFCPKWTNVTVINLNCLACWCFLRWLKKREIRCMSLDWHHSKINSQESLGNSVQFPLLFSSRHLLTKPMVLPLPPASSFEECSSTRPPLRRNHSLSPSFEVFENNTCQTGPPL